MAQKKEITQFDVLNEMPKNSVDIFANQVVGGKSLGKKSKGNALLEVLVDDNTFQDFAYAAVHRQVKEGSKRRYYMFYSIDADEYDKQHEILKNK